MSLLPKKKPREVIPEIATKLFKKAQDHSKIRIDSNVARAEAYVETRKRLTAHALKLAGITSRREKRFLFDLIMTPRGKVPDEKIKRVLEESLNSGALDPKKLHRFVSILYAFRKEALRNHSMDWVSNSVADAIFQLDVLNVVSKHPGRSKDRTRVEPQKAQVDAQQIARLARKISTATSSHLDMKDMSQLDLFTALDARGLTTLGTHNFEGLNAIHDALTKGEIPRLRKLLQDAKLLE